MAHYRATFIIGVIVWYTVSGVSNVQAIARSIQDTLEVPSSSPAASLFQPPVSAKSAVPDSAPGPTEEDSAPGPTEEDSAPGPTEEDYVSGPTEEDFAPGPTEEDVAPGPTEEDAAPGPTQKDIDINFDTLTNIADLTPKIDHINNFDFSSMKIDTTAKDLCKGTDYNKECLAAILPDLHKQGGEGNGVFEPKDVMRLEADSLFKKANATLDYAKRLLEDSKTEIPVKEAMSVCVENYDLLITNLEEAKTAMDSGDYKSLESVMSAAISDLSTCSDSFAELPDVESPTASLDELLKKLCSNILVMSRMVLNQ